MSKDVEPFIPSSILLFYITIKGFKEIYNSKKNSRKPVKSMIRWGEFGESLKTLKGTTFMNLLSKPLNKHGYIGSNSKYHTV